MKLAYIYHRNAADPEVQSGRPASLLHHLSALGVDVDPIFPLPRPRVPGSTRYKILSRIIGQYYRADRDPICLRALAREAENRLRSSACDIIFCPGSEAIAALQTRHPITFCADATFANLVDYYWDFSRVSRRYLREGHAQEKAALSRAALAVYPSDWAARSAIECYETDPKKVVVIPFGANLGSENNREQVMASIAERTLQVLRILFVGRHWQRKGGEIVVRTAELLRRQGLEIELHIVGCDVPLIHRRKNWIVRHGILRASRNAERETLSALFSRAHFVFVPSRAEAYGMTFAEANAFGVPAIATDTGGIPTIIQSGVNGYILPIDAAAEDYAHVISKAAATPSCYRELAKRSFREFEERLNWRVFCQRYLEHANALILGSPATIAS